MLRDIAEQLTELILERFAPTEQRFALQESRDAATIYQRFAFLRSLITGDTFDAAIRQILARPHRAWISEEEPRRPGQGLRGSSTLVRQLTRPGPRVLWTESAHGSWLPSVPAQLKAVRTEETVDTPENRFVRFALTRWREVVTQLGDALDRELSSYPVQRGRREIRTLVDHLDSLLSEDLFREIGTLTYLPGGSQVLQKREGYRDVFRAYVQFEAAALLAWEGGEDVYSAGQRDVATLYEFWVFLEVVKVVSGLCDVAFDLEPLIEVRPDGLGLGLRRGRKSVLRGVVTRLGRRLRIRLYFNRSFGTGGPTAGSWTRPMRPDCSLVIQSDEGSSHQVGDVWLHFDAKYRVDNIVDLFGSEPSIPAEQEMQVLDGEQAAEGRGVALRADLLKMHAYRDAIRRSAGSYVIYPGNTQEDCFMYHEVLPGLGAFALRPMEGGDARGTAALRRFMNDVLDHVSSQVTQHERWRFWTREVYRSENQIQERIDAAPFLTHPPADTTVLLGYVKNSEHLQWIRQNGRYNLRADGRGSVGLSSSQLATQLVMLYGADVPAVELWHVEGEPELVTRARMLRLGYPDPSVELYFCLKMRPVNREEWPLVISRESVETLRRQVKPSVAAGAPVTTTWLELVRSTSM
jgi:uncharacterized protein